MRIVNTNNTVTIKNLQHYDWDVMQSFWNSSPTWQNSNTILDTLQQDRISLGAYFNDELIGYVIYNPTNKRLQQIAIASAFRRKRIASTLISELIKKYGHSLSIINVDKKAEDMKLFFNTIGLKNNLEQLEMELDLNNTTAN